MVLPIEQIESVVEAYQKATEFNQLTPGREATVVYLTADEADEVMITGDLHGNRRNFNLIKKIAGLDKHPRRHLILQEVCHGGPQYVANGGCMSHTMLEDVARLKVQFPEQVHFLLGNHELSEMTDYPIQKNRQMLNLMFRMGMQHAYGPAAEKVRSAAVEFIGSCPLAIRLPEGIFISHSIPERIDSRRFDPTIFSRVVDSAEFHERGPIFDLVWGRDYRKENAEAFARLVQATLFINGHEPCPRGHSQPNPLQIILDCCGETACYLMLRPDHRMSSQEIVRHIQTLA